jgi:hypothetical protein
VNSECGVPIVACQLGAISKPYLIANSNDATSKEVPPFYTRQRKTINVAVIHGQYRYIVT